MTIIIIIFIVLFIIGLSSSERPSETRVQHQKDARAQQRDTLQELLEQRRVITNYAHKMKELHAAIVLKEIESLGTSQNAESNSQKLSAEKKPKQEQVIHSKEINWPKHSSINSPKATTQETPAQAVIREFKNRNVTSLWHMTHKDNVASILKNGISSKNKMSKSGEVVDISNQSVQALRVRNETIYNRSLHDYAPTYINIRNPMLYVKKDFNNDICLLEISIECLEECEFVFTDGNAASLVTCFFNTAKNVESLPWDVLNADFWTGFVDGKRKRCAEILIHPVIKPNYIKRIHCYSAATFLEVANSDFKFELESAMYY